MVGDAGRMGSSHGEGHGCAFYASGVNGVAGTGMIARGGCMQLFR